MLLGQRVAVRHLQYDMAGRQISNADPKRVHDVLEVKTFAHPRVKVRVFRFKFHHRVISLPPFIHDDQF